MIEYLSKTWKAWTLLAGLVLSGVVVAESGYVGLPERVTSNTIAINSMDTALKATVQSNALTACLALADQVPDIYWGDCVDDPVSVLAEVKRRRQPVPPQ